jgi:hypothetical protein
MKVTYFITVEVEVNSNFGFSSSTHKHQLPIEILADPGDLSDIPKKTIDVTKKGL